MQEEWAQLAKRLEIQLIQISERDTQLSSIPRKPDEFTCTWCPSAMMDESSESSQVPLGTHEPEVPIANRPGSEIKVPELWFIVVVVVLNTFSARSWCSSHLVLKQFCRKQHCAQLEPCYG
jgi:homospermidine synthase